MEVKLLGLTNEEFLKHQIQICAAAGKLSRMPGSVNDAIMAMDDIEKALKFIKRVIGMGHTSTIDHDYMVFSLSNVSPVIEQTIIAERFSSFTIKSRREVDFSKVGFYTPDFHTEDGEISKHNDELKIKYQEYMNSLFSSYEQFVSKGITKEDARFILPYSYHSEIIMGLDGTSLARMINILTKTKYSNITELKELGNRLHEIAKTRAPYIDAVLDKSPVVLESNTEKILDNLGIKKEYVLQDKPVLLSYTNNLDETIFINAISRITGKTTDEAQRLYDKLIKDNEEIKTKLMKSIFNEVNNEDLRQVNMRFQFSVPYAILTHFTRHRRQSLSIPDFVPNADLEKYTTPPKIKQNSELNVLYEEIFKQNKIMRDEFKSFGIKDEDLVYFTLSGNTVNVIINFDGEAFRWICRLRECTKAQWCIREIVTKMHEELNEISKYYASNLGPDCVTKHICGEGKESCGRLKLILKKEGLEK